MSQRAQAEKANEEYLSAALTWLRLLLLRAAGPEPSPVVLTPDAPEEAPAPGTPRRRLFRRQQPAAGINERAQTPATHLLPPAQPLDLVTDEQLQEALDALRRAEASDPPPQLILLGVRFGLSQFERDVLLLCAAMELDTRIAALCARAHDDPAKPYPTFGLALALFENPSWEELAATGRLRYWRLVEVRQADGQPLIASALSADERILDFIKGLGDVDAFGERLSAFLAPLEVAGSGGALPHSQQVVADMIVNILSQQATRPELPAIHLLGTDSASKQLVALHAASAMGLRLYRLPAEMLPQQAPELETLARLIRREARLTAVAAYLDAHEYDAQSPEDAHVWLSLRRLLSRVGETVFLSTRDVLPDLTKSAVPVDVSKPTAAEQRDAWAAALGLHAGDSPARLAAQFDLDSTSISRVADQVISRDAGDEIPLAVVREQLWDACLLHTRPRLERLAQRIEAKAKWDDLVLPPNEKALLRQIADQVGRRGKVYEEWGFARKMNRGLGISALFAGDSGTGKTMSAEVIANDLRLDLYRIDLSAVVSKYIGETEKNLRRLFDAAEGGGAILFFDEADALFGKRSEVKDAHDRYANIEVGYLLTRMEAFRGLAILATNMKSSLDEAFMRRLRFIVDFPYPGEPERKDIWQRVFPAQAETRGLDYDRLARLSIPGGAIHNVALNAAFMAAQAGTPITMPLILRAAEQEFRKLGRPVNVKDFSWHEPAVGVVA
ncbi:MAG TPA: ATP-binding protein [Pyrinomonadaceae bacterium]|nr:ATP-binding protein [Pyrinomonadaceae bacterium]